MKSKILITMALLCFIGFSSCDDDLSSPPPPMGGADCMYVPFIDAYSMYLYDDYYKNDDFYFVKGAALDVVCGYGRRIELIEDFKGNFPKEVSIFTVWGDGVSFIELNRVDYLSDYKNQDTLIMLLGPAADYKYEIPPGGVWYEKKGDYTTLGCAHSVLKLSNGYVTGFILPIDERIASKWWWYFSKEEMDSLIVNMSPEEYKSMVLDTMLYTDLQKRLQEIKQ